MVVRLATGRKRATKKVVRRAPYRKKREPEPDLPIAENYYDPWEKPPKPRDMKNPAARAEQRAEMDRWRAANPPKPPSRRRVTFDIPPPLPIHPNRPRPWNMNDPADRAERAAYMRRWRAENAAKPKEPDRYKGPPPLPLHVPKPKRRK